MMDGCPLGHDGRLQAMKKWGELGVCELRMPRDPVYEAAATD